jgi:hypothetical protein
MPRPATPQALYDAYHAAQRELEAARYDRDETAAHAGRATPAQHARVATALQALRAAEQALWQARPAVAVRQCAQHARGGR